MKTQNRTFTIDELAALVEMSRRTVRYYIQNGLVDRPEGVGKGAYYTHAHLEQLLAIRKWKEAGLSLERIEELLGGEGRDEASGKPLPPPRARKPGSVEVWSHLHIADGVELHIEPRRAGLTPEQVRALARLALEHYTHIRGEQ